MLLAVFYLVDAPRIVGETDDTLAWRALIGLLAAGCVFLVLLQRRTPSTRMADVSAVRNRSRGRRAADPRERRISSGLGGVLIVSVGTLALLLPTERAFLLAAVSTLVLLGQQTYCAAARHHDGRRSSRPSASSAP